MTDWPNDYRCLQTTGLIDRLVDAKDPLMIWDADFLSASEISSFESLDDQIVGITPFAVTCGGDYWAYLTDNLPSSEIVLCYRDSYDAEYFARNFAQFIFRQTITFAGNEGLRRGGGAWSVESAKQMIALICSDLGEFISERMLDRLRQLVNESKIHTTDEWTTLISEGVSRRLIEELVVLDRDDISFQWRA